MHPQARPLPAQPIPMPEPGFFQPSDSDQEDLGYPRSSAAETQDRLFEELEQTVMGSNLNSVGTYGQSFGMQARYQDNAYTRSGLNHGSIHNGHPLPDMPYDASGGSPSHGDSDPEGTHGLSLLAMEDKQYGSSVLSIERHPSGSSTQQPSGDENEDQSDGEGYGVDLGSYGADISNLGGGPNVEMHYGGDPAQLAGGRNPSRDRINPFDSPQSSIHRSSASQSSRPERDYMTSNPLTGGLSEPGVQGRRNSFDEGDEDTLIDGIMPELFPGEPLNIPFSLAQPQRPLPDLPSEYERKSLPPIPGSGINPSSQYVPRSSSLVGYSHTPQVSQPSRSKTDAEDRRIKFQQGKGNSMYSINMPSGSTMTMDLPAIAKRFNPAKLGASEFQRCEEPWALSKLLQWLIEVTKPEQNTELREGNIKEALVALFTSKVPTMNIADAEVLSSRVIFDMYDAGTLIKTEEWVKLTMGPISGVIFQLTQSGCYSNLVHNDVIPNLRCYSYHCQRTLKKVDLLAQPSRMTESWADFYHLQKADYENRDKKELELQYNLHEIVFTEESYMASLEVVRTLYRDELTSIEPSVITPKRRDKFLTEVFGGIDAVKQANEEHLLPQLKYRQIEQGPWIIGFSDIFRQWIRKARSAYVEYATRFPKADYLVRQEIERNIDFRKFVDRARIDRRSERLSLDSFLVSPITRLQRYALLLGTVFNLEARIPREVQSRDCIAGGQGSCARMRCASGGDAEENRPARS